jgi:uncharacterized FlgJ-related protein
MVIMKVYGYDKENLQYYEIKYLPKTLKYLGLIFGVLLILGLSSSNTVVKYITDTESILIIEDENEFSKNKLITKIKELNFKFPHIVLAQAQLETGNFTSIIFQDGMNLFGMKQARIRINTAKGTKKGHAYYNTWEESLYDYAFFSSSYLYKIKSDREYFQYLDKYYAEDPKYTKKLKQIIKKQNLKTLFDD